MDSKNDMLDFWIKQLSDDMVDQSKFTGIGLRLDVLPLLQKLKQRRESELRATKHCKIASPVDQFEHVETEIVEIADALSDVLMNRDIEGVDIVPQNDHLKEEIADAQMSLETLARCCKFSEIEMMEARRKVIEKNRKRGYYLGVE